MSKSKDKGPPPEDFHQDYIASSRYRNDLPPPEMPPKLLDIPHDGLQRFLTPGFASNLARREEPNIDVDAEGGMPIDLVGIPGLHLGDETAIMAPENPPPLHPDDLALMQTPDQLRNPLPKSTNVSFLRRTQYISSGSSRAPEPAARNPAFRPKPKNAESTKNSREDPTHIKKYIQKGFDIAYPGSKHKGEDTATRIRGLPMTKAEADAWANPVHPDNPNLKPVGFFPLIPDLQGFPDPGGYVQFKFDKAPVSENRGKRDDRMDVGVLVPSAPEERVCQEHASKAALHRANPKVYPDPGPVPWDYDVFLPSKGSTKKVKASMNISNPDRNNENNYTHQGADGAKYHRFDRTRTYATSNQTLNAEQKYKDVAVSMFDPAALPESQHSRLEQKAAYYYPILGKTRLKPERARTIAQAGLAPTRPQGKEDQVDQLQVVVRDPDEAEVHKRATHRAAVDSKFAETLPPPPEEHHEDGDGLGEAHSREQEMVDQDDDEE